MGKCSYTWEEWDKEKGRIESSCPHDTWEGSDEFCIFHDSSPDKDRDLFIEKLREQMESENEKHSFIGYVFPEDWDYFKNYEFKINTCFEKSIFQENAYFTKATFQGKVYFKEATFQGNVYFKEATFQDADFKGATFQGYANFIGTKFKDADFYGAIFQNVDFMGVIFQNVNFTIATFYQESNFIINEINILNLSFTRFFFRSYIFADLTKTLYYRSFLDNIVFVHCIWPDNYIIFEEQEMNDENINLSFEQIETIYRDLKQNMQHHGDYLTAGEFYYREMEMRREKNNWKSKSRWWLELYRFIAGYGEKPQLVIKNSFLVIFIAAFFFFFNGIIRTNIFPLLEKTPYIIDYSLHSINFNMQVLTDFGYCLYYSIVTFTTLGYGDIHPLGFSHVIASVEALIGAFFMALFVAVFVRKMAR